ncbi:hypothetical protein B0T16DRAFT_405200 [Cercophora newfieldiana]|uniref:Secreted protein n=1 Tax=Cercophora newfieldiana TaxID=92897 RepID=A0AA40CWS1_9PEZI|nr:hypothetical protein B0T16DRAFT_405200 [Cercophora newfieldiana]
MIAFKTSMTRCWYHHRVSVLGLAALVLLRLPSSNYHHDDVPSDNTTSRPNSSSTRRVRDPFIGPRRQIWLAYLHVP